MNTIGENAAGTTDLDTAEFARAASDRNMADYLRHCARHAHGGEVSDSDGVLLFAGAHHYPGGFANGMIRRDTCVPAGAALDRAEQFFGERTRGFVTWTRAHADADLVAELLDRGYSERPPTGGLHGVYCDHAPPARGDLTVRGAEVREVEDDAGYDDYIDVIAEAWQLGGAPRHVVEGVLFSAASLRPASMRVFVTYLDDEPAAASAMYYAGGIGGMQWTAVRERARGRRLGQAAFLLAWQAAFDMGATIVVGQSSAIGTPVWLSHGWTEITRYARYISPPLVHRG